jgi:hypothetical protein
VLMKSQDEFEQHSIKIQRLELQTSINLDVWYSYLNILIVLTAPPTPVANP